MYLISKILLKLINYDIHILIQIVQENSPNEVHTAPLEITSFTYDNDGLKKAVMDFEVTLERASKKKKRFFSGKGLYQNLFGDVLIPSLTIKVKLITQTEINKPASR